MAANMSEVYIKDLLKTTEKSYTFIHLDAVDGAGHDTGWCSPGYYDQVAAADRQVVLMKYPPFALFKLQSTAE